MKIGIDTNIFIAALHANHPNNTAACLWLNRVLPKNEIIIAEHSLLETYSVLTRLPVKWRLTPAETILLIKNNIKDQITIVHFPNKNFMFWIDKTALNNIEGGQIYDSYIIKTLISAKVDAIATFNISHFSNLINDVKLINPLMPEN